MDDKMKILVVDDDKKILEVVKGYLEKDGYEFITAEDGKRALDLFKETNPHLIVLDLMLPHLSGEQVCSRIRAMSDVPIIMLTAKNDEGNKLEGLAIGADDYLTKPFSPKELVGRVRALIRRAYRQQNVMADYLTFNEGDLEINILKMTVKKRGKPVIFTPNEFKLLNTLLTNPGQIFSREQLLEKAFGFEYEGFDRTIDTHIKNIRQKIEDDSKKPVYIITVYGIGYKFGGSK